MTETQKLTETKGTTEKLVETREESEIKRETQEAKEGNELNKVIDEHTHIELGRDNGVELGECFVTRCEQQDTSLRNKGRRYAPLKQIATR